MNFLQNKWKGIIFALAIAIPSTYLGKLFPITGGAVIGILSGMIIGSILKDKSAFEEGLHFVSKKILQYAVILLGFGMNLSIIIQTGKQSLPIIICTITTSLIIAYVLCKVCKIGGNISTLIGVGSAICGGSAIAATAPVIDAKEEEIAQSISVIFFFNVLAAIIFPTVGGMLGFSTVSGEAFGMFAGTAVNDTSSVTAAASTWDSLYHLGSQTLDKAVTVKLTRTLAIIPITLFLAFYKASKTSSDEKNISLKSVFPFFILFFILASIITTISINLGLSIDFFNPFKELSKFLIVMAMSAIGLNSNIVKIIKTGGKPLLVGFACWLGIAAVAGLLQNILGIW